MKWPSPKSLLPGWKNALLAFLSSLLLILAFPDFEYWFLAWFALVPLMWAVERKKESTVKSFVLGWLFGTLFFFGTCWWLAYAPIHYAAFPPLLAYSLVFLACLGAGIFPGVFAAVLSILFRRFGSIAVLAAPFVWVFSEFLRYWFTGNNWNAMGYSQFINPGLLQYAGIGGIYLSTFIVVISNLWLCGFLYLFLILANRYFQKVYRNPPGEPDSLPVSPIETLISQMKRPPRTVVFGIVAYFLVWFISGALLANARDNIRLLPTANVIAVQPNVQMSGLTLEKWRELRQRHVRLAETALNKFQISPQSANRNLQSVVIFPESPMNFQYEDDPETKAFIDGFARMNNVSVLFNSAEPDRSNGKFFNSAVMVSPEGKEVAQYDKIYLLPFGEAVPVPFESIVPAFVGSFSYGKEYDLYPVGDAKAGVMICFESHFGQLSREYVRNGADVIIEMTNDGYLGPTPVLRQHLANAVFRAVETNRPVLRVTNVGITAYINERGEVLDPATPYTEDTRVWSVTKSSGSQTFYVRYGDWFAWLCTLVTVVMLGLAVRKRESVART